MNIFKKFGVRIDGLVKEIRHGKEYDMNGMEYDSCKYVISLDDGDQVILSDKLTNSGVISLGLTVGQKVTLNGFYHLV